MAEIKISRYKLYDPIGLINDYVQKLAAEMFVSDIDCPPTFIVSLKDDKGTNEIVVTIEHKGVSFTETIFPDKSENTEYGYEYLQTTIERMYSRTM